MLINRLTLKNFRSYEEEVTFNFSPSSGKNIVLIGGENGAGKSTLFEAIKLCIYGPLSYGYQGFISNYISKIKSNINHNAYKSDQVEAFISVSLSFIEGNSINEYLITRAWSFEKTRLNESYKVEKNNSILENDELLYFENYLKSVLPPELFDFFFFDGETLSDFFSSNNSNSYLKESILKLCNYDTLRLLKKELASYQRRNTSLLGNVKDLEDKYESHTNLLNSINENIAKTEEEIYNVKSNYESLLLEKDLTEKSFRDSGGLLEEEKNKLHFEIITLGNERSNTYQDIKDFCNDTLPFLIVGDMLQPIKHQLDKEEDFSTYKSVKDKLTSTIVKETLMETVNSGIANDEVAITSIASTLCNKMFGDSFDDNFKELHMLSKNQKTDLTSFLNNFSIDDQKKSVLDKYNFIADATSKLEDLKDKFNSSVSEDILEAYNKKIQFLNEQISHSKIKLASLEKDMELLLSDKNNAEYHYTRIKNEYLKAMQSNNSLDLSLKLTSALDDIISTLIKDKVSSLENNFIHIFSELIRKDKYIDSIDIDDNFNTTLYVIKNYTGIDLRNLISNIGFDELAKKYGANFVKDLYASYGVDNKADLLKSLSTADFFTQIPLRTKVNVHDFSKGEKQIYMLCLIWALIKTSGVNIPFIIDTPYARIDDSHRNAITNKYLPSISNQVIILSTNKEIDETGYKDIKEYLCNEYLLKYLDEERKTKVLEGYFFEV